MADPGWLLRRAEKAWEKHREILEPLARKCVGADLVSARRRPSVCESHPDSMWAATSTAPTGKTGPFGFSGGAGWMLTALRLLRDEAIHGSTGGPPVITTGPQADPGRSPSLHPSSLIPHPLPFSGDLLGFLKYAAATLAGLSAFLPAFWLGPLWFFAAFPLGILLFYAVEAQGVFLFPAALDGSPTPWKTSRELMVRSGGTIVAILTILRLAFRMLTGGFLGGGFVRSWCLGCMGVLIWYEQARGEGWTTDETSLPKLSLGGRGPILVRIEKVPLAKARGRVAFVSDLHWNGRTCPNTAASIVAALRAMKPDAVVLGGDLADTRAGLPAVAALVASLAKHFPVLFLPGNHDEAVGLDLFRDTLENAGAIWLETWNPPRPLGWSLAGPSSPAEGATIRCRHDPARWKNDTAEVTLAGHLHGGQCELWRSGGSHFPAAWFYRWCGLSFSREGRFLIVSRGLGDTFPLRWKTPREIVVVEFES